jgi:DNA-binding CsgD family transcriptional regulator
LQRRLPSPLFPSFHAAGPLLPTLFASPVVGVAVLDSGMRYRAVNGALARMNGVPAARHAGKRPRHVFGDAATKVEGAIDQVVGSGKPVSLDITLQLPLRAGIGHWLESFSAIRDEKGHVTQVVAVVLEITKRENLERSLNHLVGGLLQIRTRSKNEAEFPRTTEGQSDEQSELLTQSVELATKCIKEVQALCQGPNLHASAKLPQVERLDIKDPAPKEVSTQPLSPRERAVLRLLADGKNNKEVGALLGISVRTAEAYRARLMNKVEIHSLAHLVRFAVRNKIIEL